MNFRNFFPVVIIGLTLFFYNNCGRFSTRASDSIHQQESQNSSDQNHSSITPSPQPIPLTQTPASSPNNSPLPQSSNPYPVGINEPEGMTLRVDCPFEDISSCNLKDYFSTATIQVDPSAPLPPSKVLRSRIEANSDTGGMQVGHSLGDIYRELYVGIMWRTNAGFITNPTAANKMWFIRGPKTNGFFGLNLGIGASTGTIGFGHNTGGLDNSHTCAADLGLICEPKAGNSPVTVGKWALLEAYIKTSTTATSRDGIVRWWVNGVMVGNYQDMNYPGGLNEWIWTETWGGASVNLPVAREHYLNHLRISVRK